MIKTIRPKRTGTRVKPIRRQDPNTQYSTRWKRQARAFIGAYPLCVSCLCEGRITSSRVVDHIVPHGGDAGLFWDAENLEPLCKTCHDGPKQRCEKTGVDWIEYLNERIRKMRTRKFVLLSGSLMPPAIRGRLIYSDDGEGGAER